MPLRTREEYIVQLEQQAQARTDEILALGSDAIDQGIESFRVNFGGSFSGWETVNNVMPRVIESFGASGWRVIIKEVALGYVEFNLVFDEG